MYEELRILRVLLTKHLMVRKRHWIGSIIELIFPICVIVILVAGRSGADIERNHVNETSLFPIESKDEIMRDYYASKKDKINLLYHPRNKFTDILMENVTRCMQLNDDRKHYLH